MKGLLNPKIVRISFLCFYIIGKFSLYAEAMGLFHPAEVLLFLLHICWKRSLATEMRGSIKKKIACTSIVACLFSTKKKRYRMSLSNAMA